jgi:hypothetical protein
MAMGVFSFPTAQAYALLAITRSQFIVSFTLPAQFPQSTQLSTSSTVIDLLKFTTPFSLTLPVAIC